MRRCIFCGGAATSREDAWPRWLTERFKSAKPMELRAERRGGQLKSWRLLRPELAVRCVCKLCNNGWMSDLENQVKPLFVSMLDGARTVLDFVAQTTLAVWGMKTAMVLEHIEIPGRGRFTDEERRQLRMLSILPSRTSAWLGAVNQSGLMFSARTDHDAGPKEGAAAAQANTLVFGHVALQFFTLRVTPPVPQETRVEVDVRAGPWDETTVPIWPAGKEFVVWPPLMAFNEEVGVNQLADRFSVATLEQRETSRLAV